ncbi:MAG: hypothetical protein JXA21_08145 [Anaerolineae bacterium]|nr:hypothetical protein [Anaerolineae bacterium]
MQGSQPPSVPDLYSDDARKTIARRFFEPQLAALNLSEDQLAAQSTSELTRSLERLGDALAHPEGFGVLRLKLTPQGYVVALADSSYHYEMTITPLLLERKQWIQDCLRSIPVATSPAASAGCADFEIHILPRAAALDAGGDYPVDLTLDGEHVWRGRMPAAVAAWASCGDPVEDGRQLFAMLFGDPELRSGWAEARGLAPERRIRLWLDVDEPALHTLPWELLRDETLLLSANARTPFSRYLPARQDWGAAAIERPLRMLVVIANPADLPERALAPLDVAAERDLLTSALQILPPDLLQLDFLDPPVTLSRLEARLRAQAAPDEAEALAREVYAWTRGYPYLTQRLGSLLADRCEDSEGVPPDCVAASVETLLRGDALLRHLRRALTEQDLLVAARTLLDDQPRFSRLDEDLARLELLGLAAGRDGRWAVRNRVLAEALQ